MKTYYLDHNATTPLASEVLEAMKPYFSEHFGNPSSLHQTGRVPARALREARKETSLLLGASEESEVVFTSGGTEGNNTALRSALALANGKKQIVTSAVEHSSIRKLCHQLKKEGFEIREVGVNAEGELDLAALRSALTDQTAVASLMYANNETGVLFPIEKAAAMVKEHGILFHVDAVQAAGKTPLDLKNCGIDYLSISAHKFYGPKGVGALYIKKGTAYRSLIFGGSQERGRRAGTENVPGIVGMGAACRLALREMAQVCERLTLLRDQFEKKVVEKIPGVLINGGKAGRLSNTSNLNFKNVDAEALLLSLDQKGVYASSGSACMSGSQEPSHVLRAMGLGDDDANSSVRFSFGRTTSADDIDAVISILAETVARLRSLDPTEQHTHRPSK